jgi:hypothetical protein
MPRRCGLSIRPEYPRTDPRGGLTCKKGVPLLAIGLHAGLTNPHVIISKSIFITYMYVCMYKNYTFPLTTYEKMLTKLS